MTEESNSSDPGKNIDMQSVLSEVRSFPPDPSFSEKARVKSFDEYKALYDESVNDPEQFWADVAEELHWFKKWDRVLNESEAPFFKWFEGGKTNICYNCIDRHLETDAGDRKAIIWEGEPGDTRVLTYRDLSTQTNQFANALKKLGIKKGDRIAIYLPMIPELAIACLACVRIGAVHTVIFAGFSADSIRDRILDSGSKLVITADGGWRRGKVLPLKDIVDEAIDGVDCITGSVVVRRSRNGETACKIREGFDHWYHEIVENESSDCPAEEMDAEDLLFLLYTSGTTGKPKGIIHTTGGYMVFSYYTSKVVFDLRPEDVYWCTADIGWITGHTYILYGILQNGATQVIYEGAPNHPDESRFWKIVEQYGVSIFYTAPTAIRAFMKWGDHHVDKHDLSSLRLLGTVGEPINPEAWMWYHEKIGNKQCPIVDTWWQTETGGHMITPIPGAISTKPGSATLPFFGIDAAVLNEAGEEVKAGILAIRKPWPGILRGIWGDPERFKATYFSKWGGKYYLPGDGAHRDDDGYFWILGRIDDVVNVSGHRIGTAELESVYVEHPAVAESAVIGIKHEIKGQGLVSFVVVRSGYEDDSSQLRDELNRLVARKIGKFALPERIVLCTDLPKTRSGKIMRRILRNIVDQNDIGNVTTLADPAIVEEIREKWSSHSA